MHFLYGYLGPNAKAVFTTNIGGNSLGEYSDEQGLGLNLGNHVGDSPEKVSLNRSQVEQYFDVKLAFMDQTHTNIVQCVSEENYSLENADAIIIMSDKNTKTSLVPTVMVADCTPVLLANKEGNITAAVHVGRPGMVKQILPKTIEKFLELGVEPGHIYACIGPSICGNCYEVDEQTYVDCVGVEPNSAWVTPQNTNAINVRKAVEDQLKRNKVLNIASVEVCTFENDVFYSYRRAKVCGRQAGFVLPVNF